MRGLKNWHKGGNSDGEAGYWLEFTYDPEIIQKIKETVPSHMREWNPDKKLWWVSELYEKQINNLFPGFLEAMTAQRKLF
jgi:hypothetical protein